MLLIIIALPEWGGLRIFDGSAITEGTVLKAFDGAYVFSNEPLVLDVPLIKAPLGGRIGFEQSKGWLLNIKISAGSLLNNISGIGMMVDANSSKDNYDYIRVPRMTNFIDLTFLHPEYFASEFARDVVPLQNNYEWEFEVNANTTAESIKLEWYQNGSLSSDMLIIYDVSANKVIDMFFDTEYNYAFSPQKQFRIIYGDKQYVANKLGEGQICLGQNYPNPAENFTTIPFSILGNEDVYNVEITITDLTGKIIAIPFEGNTLPGFHEVQWTNSDKRKELKPGIYLYTLRVNSPKTSKILHRKLILK
jgi:hypothetical protein